MNMKIVLLSLVVSMNLNAFVNEGRTNVAVFCSADNKVSQQFKTMTYNLGKGLGTHQFGLITGGSRTGLMKEVVDGYVSTNIPLHNLHGVLPEVLKDYDVHHLSIPEENLTWVKTMHTRLATFHKLADIIIVLPGGFGTMHELMDFLVNNQFALSRTPVVLINPEGYWDHLLQQFQTMIEKQLLAEKHVRALFVVDSELDCIDALISEKVVTVQQGLDDRYWEE